MKNNNQDDYGRKLPKQEIESLANDILKNGDLKPLSPYAYLTPEAIRNLMSDYNIRAEKGRWKGHLSVRKLAKEVGLNYTALNEAMNGTQAFSELQLAKLHHFFFLKSLEKEAKNFE